MSASSAPVSAPVSPVYAWCFQRFVSVSCFTSLTDDVLVFLDAQEGSRGVRSFDAAVGRQMGRAEFVSAELASAALVAVLQEFESHELDGPVRRSVAELLELRSAFLANTSSADAMRARLQALLDCDADEALLSGFADAAKWHTESAARDAVSARVSGVLASVAADRSLSAGSMVESVASGLRSALRAGFGASQSSDGAYGDALKGEAAGWRSVAGTLAHTLLKACDLLPFDHAEARSLVAAYEAVS